MVVSLLGQHQHQKYHGSISPCEENFPSASEKMATSSSISAGARGWVNRLQSSIEENPSGTGLFFQLSTLGLDGSPRCRTVVHRVLMDDRSEERPHLLICTSTQSDKWAELMKDSRFEICWYFGGSREQYRMRGSRVRFLLKGKDFQADQVWNEMSATAKEMFLKNTASKSEPVNFGVLAFHPTFVQLLDLRTGEVSTWE